jgi:hypothetical protein
MVRWKLLVAVGSLMGPRDEPEDDNGWVLSAILGDFHALPVLCW